jgi:beta-glucosidase/6-phospho-beta-glucosidase/beta-galactosidase
MVFKSRYFKDHIEAMDKAIGLGNGGITAYTAWSLFEYVSRRFLVSQPD